MLVQEMARGVGLVIFALRPDGDAREVPVQLQCDRSASPGLVLTPALVPAVVEVTNSASDLPLATGINHQGRGLHPRSAALQKRGQLSGDSFRQVNPEPAAGHGLQP